MTYSNPAKVLVQHLEVLQMSSCLLGLLVPDTSLLGSLHVA